MICPVIVYYKSSKFAKVFIISSCGQKKNRCGVGCDVSEEGGEQIEVKFKGRVKGRIIEVGY